MTALPGELPGEALRLESLGKRYAGRVVLEDLSLAVAEGEIIALLGPSGSGKTTALRLVAGFEMPDEGRVLLRGRDVSAVRPERRGVGMVFQNYALFPHLSVGENVGFGLRGVGLRGEAARERVRETLEMVGLGGLEPRRIAELSGGMQQRVAVARALAPRPLLLLLDEPLSNLDPALRERTRRELRRLITATKTTTLLVTHEQEEAFDLADRVAVLHRGRLDQVGRPVELHDRPATAFVAGFVGRAAELPARRVASPPGAAAPGSDFAVDLVDRAGRRLGGPWAVVAPRGRGEPTPGEEWSVFVRPDDLGLVAPEREEVPAIAGIVTAVRFGRPMALARVRLGEGAEIEIAVRFEAVAVGEVVRVAPGPGRRLAAFRVSDAASDGDPGDGR